MLVSDKSTGQTVVNGASSNVTYSFVSMVAGYDLNIIIKNYKSQSFPIDEYTHEYKGYAFMQVQGVIFPGPMLVIPRNREFPFLNHIIFILIALTHICVDMYVLVWAC